MQHPLLERGQKVDLMCWIPSWVHVGKKIETPLGSALWTGVLTLESLEVPYDVFALTGLLLIFLLVSFGRADSIIRAAVDAWRCSLSAIPLK